MFANQSVNSSAIHFEEPRALRIFRLIIFSLVIVASLLGNAVVLKAVFELTRKSVTHYLVANLAAAEIIVSILNPFIVAYSEFMYWPFGSFLCRLISPMQTFSIVVITNTLAAIALHRYRVFSTHHTRRKLSSKEIGLVLLMIWVIALAIVFPSFLFQRLTPANPKRFPGKFWCIEIFPDGPEFPSPMMRRFYMARFLLNYVIPVIIMSASYGFVSVKLRHHRNRSIRDNEITRNTSEQENDPTTQQPNVSSQQPQQQNGAGESIEMATKAAENKNSSRSRPAYGVRDRMTRRKDFVRLERDLLKMFYIIILVFLVCYFPYQVFFLLEYFGVIHWETWKYFTVIRNYAFLIPCFSSALHPLCYGTMSKFFARALSRLVLCKNRD
ncbi:tachykinin-like peptides receptor 86C [Actinia tenebrosa]|uniref:Tachykinin-like peptides receptor 86C n=1 Tax=Actinia tenebrosa TaxID=6105 RepID=A0A6P8HWI7_ACTTE|nr:tachykinin-like peptides receptor 86C [Actinia tenebrosa]